MTQISFIKSYYYMMMNQCLLYLRQDPQVGGLAVVASLFISLLHYNLIGQCMLCVSYSVLNHIIALFLL